MITYILVIAIILLLVVLSFIVGYWVGKQVGLHDKAIRYLCMFLDDLERACTELGKPNWFDMITDKMQEIREREDSK